MTAGDSRLPASASWLNKLNSEQRLAVVHGADAGGECGPLLVIAGAGSGKTNTLGRPTELLLFEGCGGFCAHREAIAAARYR